MAKSTSSSVITSGGKSLTVSLMPAVMRIKSSSNPSCTSLAAVPGGPSNSTAIISPLPLTSRIGYVSASLTSAFIICDPLALALAIIFSSMMASSVPTAAAHPRALPPYVPPIMPGVILENMSSLAAKPAKGNPLAIPFANIIMSGCTFVRVWCPHHSPVRATPDCTSSNMSSMLFWSQIFLSSSRYPLGGTRNPPSPRIGSMMIAAVSLG
mmetsp:Transcript_1386/g.2857  ORF Transcript_1386/g.2857 Transcript_1386/m.2857 type:complete len:211 (-) Transcript_1386:745-1377(-)